jgi:hypothetical protein
MNQVNPGMQSTLVKCRLVLPGEVGEEKHCQPTLVVHTPSVALHWDLDVSTKDPTREPWSFVRY